MRMWKILSRNVGFALMFNNSLLPGVSDFGFGEFVFDIGTEVQAFGPGGHQRQMGDFGDVLVLADAAVFHCSGITCAISRDAMESTMDAIKLAVADGLTIFIGQVGGAGFIVAFRGLVI